jgi:hypothetical protein
VAVAARQWRAVPRSSKHGSVVIAAITGYLVRPTEGDDRRALAQEAVERGGLASRESVKTSLAPVRRS